MNLEDRATDSAEQRGKPLHLGIELHLRGLLGWGIQRIRTSPPLGDVDSSDVDSSDADSSSVLKMEPPAPSKGSLEQQAATVAGCRDCDLCETRNLTAFGVGDPSADLLLVGAAPGEEEDRCGEPFVGPAGQLLDRMIAALGLSRDRVYITNVLKCRPPQNRQPQPEEVAACQGYLEAQIDLLKPTMIVALGGPAACWFTGQETSLASMRGQDHIWRGIPVVATYHPAFLLGQPQFKADCWHDLQRVIETLGLTPPRPRR